MKMNGYKLLTLSIVLFFFSINANAQFASSKKKGKDLIVAIGGGVGISEGGATLTGGNVMLELRKPFVVFQNNYSITANLMATASFGSSKEKGEDATFGAVPAGIAAVCFNAYGQSTRIAKNFLGGYIGAGLIFTPSQNVERRNETLSTGMFGPAVLLGPRVRIGNMYLDLRLYGGTTVGDVSSTFGGVNVLFTLGMGKKKNFNMR